MILVLLNHTKIKFHSGKQCTQTMHFRADAVQMVSQKMGFNKSCNFLKMT